MAWNKANTERRRKITKRSRAKKPRKYGVAHSLRVRLGLAIKNSQKAGSAVRDLGCSIDELRTHLGRQFAHGMEWDNYGEWHIDHIRPLASFDLTDREQFLLAVHYTNLQPLWAKDNLAKGARLDTDQAV